MDHLLFETSKPAQLESVREMRHLLSQVAKVSVPQQIIRRRILLCLSEVVTNLVQYNQASEASNIHLRFGHNNIGWWLEICDLGEPWDPTNQKYTDINDVLSTFDVAESGRGIAILHSECDRLDYRSGGVSKPNKLRLTWFSKNKNTTTRILLVEDDPAMSRLYAAYLDLHFDVYTVSNGNEALHALATQSFNLVLSDIQMPEMNGFSLREKLNNKKSTQLIPFIFITALDDVDMKHQATHLGVDDYLVKPVKKAQLIQSINRVLERSSQVHQQLTERIEKRITASLMPNLPKHSHGWQLCVARRHTGFGGGDFLLHQPNDENLMLMLADIMGHDDSAKFFAFAYAGYLRGLVQTAGAKLEPSKLLEQLSEDALRDDFLSQILLTCCAITLSPEGKFTIACAGHPPPLLITEAGVNTLSISGTLPGLTSKTQYQSISKNVKHGERLALYTDGLFESANDIESRLQLENEIMKTLHSTLNRPLEDSLEITMHIFDQLAGSPPQDDAMLILLEPI